ncbi:hypothetical protein MHN80_09910 [Gordonia McavH-238-E]|uniref:hypothetical protein n=1 Tax=Gordonia sp. McavH-238-E TaxID=2917736 RepID=UPI001EF743BB|nr:hypothetical protein [Gordonia sp. McavH-238-E]MCG7632625.1 hypothetical protein [Gordonia sp. McavH-238-E]
MVTSERFSQIAGSYWTSLLPRLSHFVSLSNAAAEQYAEPLLLISSPARRPLITETAFVAWKTKAMNGAEEIARSRLAVLWNQIPMADAISESEHADVDLIRTRLEAIEQIVGVNDLVVEPSLPGCGFLEGGAPDFLARVAVEPRPGLVLGEIKMVERQFRSSDYRQMICYLVLYYAQNSKILEFLWLVNPVRGVVVRIDVDSLFMLVRGQPSSEAVPEIAYEWSSPGVSP